jgi:prolyl-tRNA editing enzyme YbaK/EbsC (Cys-tRNA(Pro) deacylase)
VEAATQLGLTIAVTEFPQGTRTAVDAANAIGCTVGQIVKSLCFTVQGEPVMALVSGDNQLDERKLAAAFGVGRKQVTRAAADTVRAATGFAIGGVPPFGHLQPMTIFVDDDLAQYEIIWAAGGTPNTVFPITPEQLTAVTGGRWLDLKR